MSDDLELELIRKRRLLELQKKLKLKEDAKQVAKEGAEKHEPPEKILNKVFEGRAWEVWKAAENQYPSVAGKLKEVLVQLISQGKITRVTGEQLMYLFRKVGLNVRLPTRIKIIESGEIKTLEQKLKERGF